jgi:hypothetical protein
MSLWDRIRPRTREEAASREQQLLLDYRHAFGSEAGKRVLDDLMTRTGVARSTIVRGDPHASAFNEGRRSIGLEIVRAINTHPDAAKRLLASGDIDGVTHE